MKNTFGNSIIVTVFGESHGMAVGAVLDGLPAGIGVSMANINEMLHLRHPKDKTATLRQEEDEVSILGGVFNNFTTGTPLTLTIQNKDMHSGDYQYGVARPSHVDYVARKRYGGFEDYRGGGHFSGRVTAALVAAGGILLPVLNNLGIKVGTHILQCGSICDRNFEILPNDLDFLSKRNFPVLEFGVEEKMTEVIMRAADDKDSIGGLVQTGIYGLPAGLGEPWFDGFESMLSHIIFSIGGIKGIEFGLGFAFANKKGSEVNDSFVIKDEKVSTKTNNNGGINGGLTNGMPVVFQCVVKPTASIGKAQETIDFVKNENVIMELKGRHDPAIIRRICPVIDSVTALVVADMLSQRYGADILVKKDLLCNLV